MRHPNHKWSIDHQDSTKENTPTGEHPLNDIAMALLPDCDKDTSDDACIFRLVKKSDNVAKYVRRIAEKAGIEKDFTYHSSRHTTATLAISAGADISTVKELWVIQASHQQRFTQRSTSTPRLRLSA